MGVEYSPEEASCRKSARARARRVFVRVQREHLTHDESRADWAAPAAATFGASSAAGGQRETA